jgi:hypothetical protein
VLWQFWLQPVFGYGTGTGVGDFDGMVTSTGGVGVLSLADAIPMDAAPIAKDAIAKVENVRMRLIKFIDRWSFN